MLLELDPSLALELAAPPVPLDDSADVDDALEDAEELDEDDAPEEDDPVLALELPLDVDPELVVASSPSRHAANVTSANNPKKRRAWRIEDRQCLTAGVT